MYPTALNPVEMYELADDFFNLDTVKWTSIDDASTGTNTANAVAGGQVSIVTAGADNDYHFMASATKGFLIANDKPINLVARFSVTEANTSASNWAIGLTSDASATVMGSDGAGPTASYSGCLLFKVDGTMAIQFETSNAGNQVTNASLATFTSGVTYQVGFHVNPNDGVTALVTPWVYNETTGVQTIGTVHKLAIASLAQMALLYGIKAGSSSAETLKIDYIRCCQKR